MWIMARFLISLVVLGILTVTMCELLKERMQLVNTFLSHQDLPRCSQTETGQFLTCAIKNGTDARAMAVLIDSCGSEQHVQECPYGSTCVMLSCNAKGDVSYDCLCHSAKPSHIISSTYAWSRWIPFSHSRVFGFSRELRDTSVTDPPILAREYRYARWKINFFLFVENRSQRIKISLFFQCSIFRCIFSFDADVTLAGPSLSLIRPDSYYCINTDKGYIYCRFGNSRVVRFSQICDF